MPLLENDVIFAYLNRADPNHRTAERIFSATNDFMNSSYFISERSRTRSSGIFSKCSRLSVKTA